MKRDFRKLLAKVASEIVMEYPGGDYKRKGHVRLPERGVGLVEVSVRHVNEERLKQIAREEELLEQEDTSA